MQGFFRVTYIAMSLTEESNPQQYRVSAKVIKMCHHICMKRNRVIKGSFSLLVRCSGSILYRIEPRRKDKQEK